VPNKITRDVKEIAQEYGPSAIRRLAWFAGLLPNQPGAINPVAQIAAIKELLDRGYGKATQPLANDAGKPLVIDFRWSDDTAVSPALQPIIEAVAEHDPAVDRETDRPLAGTASTTTACSVSDNATLSGGVPNEICGITSADRKSVLRLTH
jgi:hypothetical protein